MKYFFDAVVVKVLLNELQMFDWHLPSSRKMKKITEKKENSVRLRIRSSGIHMHMHNPNQQKHFNHFQKDWDSIFLNGILAKWKVFPYVAPHGENRKLKLAMWYTIRKCWKIFLKYDRY